MKLIIKENNTEETPKYDESPTRRNIEKKA